MIPYRQAITTAAILLVFSLFSSGQQALFNMDQIRDEATLETEVLQDWHLVKGKIVTRQKLVSIKVGELWPGQDYRVPVRMIVPAESKACGFHLTGGHRMEEIKKDIILKEFEQDLIKENVGLVYTLVQAAAMLEQKALGDEMNRRFIETLDPHFSLPYWGWPATLMRAVTTAYAETKHFEKGKVAVSGASKNGASPSVALISDQRITALHSTVAPIWPSPLRLCDRAAWDELEKDYKGSHVFLGGTFGRIYNQAALDAGHSWEDLRELAHGMADHIFISRNLEQLKARGVDLLFHPGTHDFVVFDLPWGGAHYPRIPLYLEANTGHGYKKGLPVGEHPQQNLPAFLTDHFFKEMAPLLEAPALAYEYKNSTLQVSIKFKPESGENSGRIFWMFDRASEGSEKYLTELFPENQWKEMKHGNGGTWTTEIALPPNASTIDFFSTHGKTIQHKTRSYQTYLSCPYTRVKLKQEESVFK